MSLEEFILFPTDFKERITDLFKSRVSLNEDIEGKKLKKLDKKIDKRIEQFIEEETKSIKFRAFNKFNEQLIEITGEFNKEFTKLAKKHPTIYYRWKNEQRKKYEKLIKIVNKDEEVIAGVYANLDVEISPEEHKMMFLVSQTYITLQNVSRELKDTFALPGSRKSIQESNAFLNIITAIMLIFFRICDVTIHWENANEEERKLIEDLLYWDINTLNNFLLALPSKKMKLKKGKEPKKEILMSLFG